MYVIITNFVLKTNTDMKQLKFALLFAMLAMIGSLHAEYSNQEYKIHYVVTLPHSGDSTPLYQRIATGNPAEPYTTGAIVRRLHYPASLYKDEPQELTTEREFGLYEKDKDFFVTVNIDGQRYFISAYAISANDNTGIDWVGESLPQKPGSGIPWSTILYVILGIVVLLVIYFGGSGLYEVLIIKKIK